MTRPRRPGARRDDRGSLALAAAVAFPAALILCGLVLDGGYTLAARQRAANHAENAARVGAQQLDIPELRRTGRIRLDPPAAVRAARAHLAQARVTGTVQVSGRTVTVRVTVRQPMTLLRLTGLSHVDLTAQATARAAPGVTGPEP